jgi:hypothetical protein
MDRMHGQLVKVLGPAQFSRVREEPRRRSPDPLAGSGGGLEIRRGADGRTYLVAHDQQGD